MNRMEDNMWLSQLRLEKELTQIKVAEQVGITQQYYNYIENGKRKPSTKIAKRIAAVLGFDWTQFYDDVQEKAV